jgi:hypothetical protein
MLKKIVSGLSMIALAFAALVFMPATAAYAAITVDMTGQTIKFSQTAQTVNLYSSGQSGGFANDITVYRSAATVSGVVIDAVITVDKSLTSAYRLDAASSAVSAPPSGNTSPTAAELLQTDVTPSANNNYVTLKFQFFEGGTYTGYGTGNLLTLTNVTINSYDIDYNQFSQFKGFQSYSYASNTTLATSNKTGGWVQFSDTTGNNYSDSTGSYTKGRVRVNYDQLTELSVRHGANGTSNGYYALDFGPGYTWKDTVTRTTTTSTNPNNSAPTSANKSIFYSVSAPWVFNLSNFSYSDPENNAFTTAKIVTLPATGTLELLVGSTWTAVTAGASIPVSSLNVGNLRYTGTVNSSFTFKVNDGTADSAAAYTMTMTAATGAQTITFANPGTKQVSATAFASNATASSALTVTLTSLSTGTCSVSGLNITALANGFCTIIATQIGNASFGEAPAVTVTFPISNLTAQTITLANPATQTVSTTLTIAPVSNSVSPVANTLLTVSVISQTTSVCTISGFVVTHVATGTCVLRATQPGNSSWAPAAPVEVTYLVNNGSKTAQTISFAQPADQALATASISVSATASSGLAITFTSSTTSICTVSSTTVSFVASGYCTISATQAGNSTYASQTLSRSFYILEITTSSIADGTVNSAFSQTLGAYGGSSATDAWSNTGTLPAGLTLNASTGEISGTPTSAQSATSYTFTVVNGGITATRTLSITIASAPTITLTANTITFNALADVSFTNGPVTLGATASSGLTVAYQSNTTSVCTISTNVITLRTDGYCEILADQPGDSTYAAAAQVTQGFFVFKISTPSVTSGSVGSPYSQQMNTAGERGAGSWSATGLPTGFGIDPTTGLLSGTPTLTLSQSITIIYTQGSSMHAETYLLTVNAAGAPPSQSKPRPSIVAANGSGLLNKAVIITPKVTPVFPFNPGLCLIDPVSKGCKPVVTIKRQGTWTLSDSGSVTFMPERDWSGTSNIVLHAWDLDGLTDDEQLSVTIGAGSGNARPPVSITISGFAPGSPALTSSIRSAIQAFLNKYSDYKKLQCTGVTMGPTVLKVDYALSMNRASNACGYAISYMRKLLLLPKANLQETFVGANIRRVILTLSDN